MSYTAPSSILIIGSGVFGLGTAYSLIQNRAFDQTEITIVDRLPFPAPDGASVGHPRECFESNAFVRRCD